MVYNFDVSYIKGAFLFFFRNELWQSEELLKAERIIQLMKLRDRIVKFAHEKHRGNSLKNCLSYWWP